MVTWTFLLLLLLGEPTTIKVEASNLIECETQREDAAEIPGVIAVSPCRPTYHA